MTLPTATFGPTGLETTVIGLGGMPLSIQGRPDRAEALRVIHAALDAGMRLIDTADVYCLDDDDIGHNEALIAEALRTWSGDADEALVCTKGGLSRPGGAWETDGDPEHLRAACERSLRALGVSAIAVYQLHAPDDDVPFADSVAALARLRDEGKIQHVGLSNVSRAELDEARAIVPIVSVQNRCNPFDLRAFEGGVVARCEELGLAFLPYSPVGGGHGKTRVGDDQILIHVGQAHGASTYEVALAWLRRKSASMFPIPGASRAESAESSARAATLELAAEDVARIDAHVGFPA
ncbi:MAG: aldo/keto reductase [Sandaracinus sp.]|nr:aldo/keto reductase [Sandaracinus sp.]|tara:strand:- start:39 stop:920 length:882 start_codon:yes stop_codon:yes gene_type:complete